MSILSFAFVLMCFSSSVLSEDPMDQLRGGEIQSKDEHQYGKVEIRMYSQPIVGTTSTFFWWRQGGQECGTKWNEIDIETIPGKNRYQSNPIWQTSDTDCNNPQRLEKLHGDATLFNRWVVYTLEWTPDYIAWYHDGRLDRSITRSNDGPLNYIKEPMRYCFNLWSQGNANPGWLGNLDFNQLRSRPVYQFVDYFRYYTWNGNGFQSTPYTSIDFNSRSDIEDKFYVSNWEFGQSMGFLSWSKNAVGIADLGNGNSALWLGLFYGEGRPPTKAEIPSNSASNNLGGTITIEAESAIYSGGLQISAQVLGFIENGAWASYAAVNIPFGGTYDVVYLASSAAGGGSIRLERAGGGEVFGSLNIPSTGSWSNYIYSAHTVTLPAGSLEIGLNFPIGGINLDKFIIKPHTG